MSTLTTEQAKYLSYTVKVNGTTYTETTDNLDVALAAGGTHPVIVRVEYSQPQDASDLPQEDQTITVTGNLDYESV